MPVRLPGCYYHKPLCNTRVKREYKFYGEIFSIGQAAKMTQMTSETLRHYDRIGLVQPSRVDEWTGYRYYSKQDVVRLHTVRALQRMDLSLQEIKEVLEYDELEEIVDFLNRAEKKAEEKIAALEYSKKKFSRSGRNMKKAAAAAKRNRSVYQGVSGTRDHALANVTDADAGKSLELPEPFL